MSKIEEKINRIQKKSISNNNDKITYEDIIYNVRQSILTVCKFFHFSFREVDEQEYEVFLQELLFIYEYHQEMQKEIDKNKNT